jgi:hypothetical protein
MIEVHESQRMIEADPRADQHQRGRLHLQSLRRQNIVRKALASQRQGKPKSVDATILSSRTLTE